jgi:transcriptional regulator with XRE-family HTH domain
MVRQTPRENNARPSLRIVTPQREADGAPVRPEPSADGPSRCEHPIDRHVGRRIKRRRIELNLNLQWLSERMGVPVEMLESFEAGAARVGAARLAAFAAFLNVPPSYFFQELESAVARPEADGGSRAQSSATAASDFQWRTMVGIFNKIGDTESRNEIITFALAKLRDEKARSLDSASPETH